MTATPTFDALSRHSLSERIEALQALAYGNRLNGSTEFALDLVRAYRRTGRLSPKQDAWVTKLIERGTSPRPAAPTEALGGDVAGIFRLFATAAARLRYPKIHLVSDEGTPVQLSVAGERSRYTGQVMITDGGPYGQNRYFGRIDREGTLTAGRDLTPTVRRLLAALAADPAAVAAAYGKRTGSCCFCHKELTTDESLAVGYGPVCAQNFGLPWGKVPPAAGAAAAAAPAAPAPKTQAEIDADHA